MNERFVLKDGTVIEFYSSLGYHGLYIEVNTRLTPEQKEMFKKEIRSERDVIRIKFN